MKTIIEHLKKLKFILKVRKPAEEMVGHAKELKRGWKKVSFWVSFIGTLLSMLAALAGHIPAQVSLIINTVLTVSYNILRGLDKMEEPGTRPVVRSTEFWQGVTGELSNGIVALQTGGVDPQWFHTAQTVILIATAIAQNLGAQQPKPGAAVEGAKP